MFAEVQIRGIKGTRGRRSSTSLHCHKHRYAARKSWRWRCKGKAKLWKEERCLHCPALHGVKVDPIVHPYMSEELQNTLEARARRRASPSGIRTRPVRVEPEPPPPTKTHKMVTTKRVAVVYYLCRNHQLEHPHFMEVPLASMQGLYLRDVINRLDALRGKGMASKYSWSCKRRYKNGFVWHDLSDGDLLLPAQGVEYVLKGSELQFDQSIPPDHQQNSIISSANVQFSNPTRQQELPSPAAPIMKEAEPPSPPAAVLSAVQKGVPPAAVEPALLSSPSASTIGYDEQCRMPHSGSSGDSSPKTSMPSSCASSPGLKNSVATQTNDKAHCNTAKLQQEQVTARVTPERPEIIDESQPKSRAAGEHPCSRRNGTLQSLIRAEAAGRRRGALEEDGRSSTTTGSVSGRLRPSNLLMCLMACGPNSLVQTSYKPRFTRLEYPSSSPELFPLGALKPQVSTVKASETDNYSGSLHDSAVVKLEHSSSSFNAHHHGVCEEARSPEGDPVNPSRSVSKRMSGPSSGTKTPSSKAAAFHGEKEKAIEMEESAGPASGARVAIH